MDLSKIRSRTDLERLRQSDAAAHAAFMERLRQSMVVQVDVAQYPEGYGEPDYPGPIVEPQFEQRENLSLISRYGLTPADFS